MDAFWQEEYFSRGGGVGGGAVGSRPYHRTIEWVTPIPPPPPPPKRKKKKKKLNKALERGGGGGGGEEMDRGSLRPERTFLFGQWVCVHSRTPNPFLPCSLKKGPKVMKKDPLTKKGYQGLLKHPSISSEAHYWRHAAGFV